MIVRIFDYKNIPDGKKVKLVTIKLRKYASLWWKNIVNGEKKAKARLGDKRK